jgi:very-short-patch-repair endonuclease
VAAADEQTNQPSLIGKAVNLFTFLMRTQQLLLKPIRTVNKFETVIWFGDLPEHPAVRSAHRDENPGPDVPLLAVERVGKQDSPALPDGLGPWVDGPTNDVDREPSLREAIYTDDAGASLESQDCEDGQASTGRRVDLAEVPDVVASFDRWLADWRMWADGERARSLYKGLFETLLMSTDHSEEFELVLGLGCLSWRPEGHEQVLRHVATAPITITLEENAGTLTVAQVTSPETVSIELDMLDPELIPSPAKIDEVRQTAREYGGHLLDRQTIGSICRRLTHLLDPDAQYDEDALTPPTESSPQGAFAPAIILRRRNNRGLVQIYEQIVAQIQALGEVPSGILPLIDPDQQPELVPSTAPGAVVSLDDEDFLPLPVNEAQRRIIDRVDRIAQTVVQGPPGTGKTHTAAALVSHLLAQGKRVLITAQTDRALREIRAKLPREVKSLAVSVIGQSRSDMADLRTAVETISRRADEFDPAESEKSIERHIAKLDELRRERAEAYARLVEIRRQEVEHRDDGPEPGTLAAVAYRHLHEKPILGWIHDFDIDPRGTGQTVSTDEIIRWRNTLLDRDVISHQAEASGRLPSLSSVMTPDEYARLVTLERQAVATKNRYQRLLMDPSFEVVRSLPSGLREELRSRVSELADWAMALERRHEIWLRDALRDVRSGRQEIWVALSTQIKSLADSADGLIERIGPTTWVEVTGGDLGAHDQMAKSLLAFVESGREIKTLPDGCPKIGALTPKTIKLAEPFFTDVKVNGVPAVTQERLATFVDWVEAHRTIAAMDRAWPTGVQIPQLPTLRQRQYWHRTEVSQLDNVLSLGDQIEAERAWLQRNGLPIPDWNNLAEIRRYGELVEAATAADQAAVAAAPLAALAEYLKAEAQWPQSPAAATNLLQAVEHRDVGEYVSAYGQLVHLHEVAEAISERDRIRAELDQSAPRLAEAIAEDPTAPEWDDLLYSYQDAWRWEMTGQWILQQEGQDSNALKAQLNVIEQQIRSEVERLAAERAWRHAVAPGRLTGSARANLTQYAQLVSSLGKGTGKYAAKKRVEIAEAMDRCRPSVPVWIMPIYRIAEQVRVQPNLYDVVIIDEASQAGLEATFLQYLAPKVVVIGDDKQVSPAAVGVDQQQLRDLAKLYISHDVYIASWQDPKRSYFDEAAMRFGGRIALTEHRRCVPEIIGFSNRIAYEPEGIPLVPVRQFGAERLEPIKAVYLPDGYEAGNKTNPVEAEAIVEQIRKCLVDPHYDGATFGVISLLGKEQAKLIEHKLLDTVSPEEWTARELRCGDASDFQGSERDVMFLSMVKAADPTRRISALTATPYMQRFNVAASRAKDQMWVYHSIPRSELTNTEDMRYQLLDYCYGVMHRTRDDTDAPVKGVVPEDMRVPPFDSLFEQRVFNRIVDRGYTVWPQYPALGYTIDLVVIGAKGKLAVECDGDFWHGPAEYEADLARQRELERCGWEFFRIRESMFYADMAATLQKLWETLDELDVRTADWIDPSLGEDAAVDGIADEPVVEQALAGLEGSGPVEDGLEMPTEPLVLRDLKAALGGGHLQYESPPGIQHQPWTPNVGMPAREGGRHRAPESVDTEDQLPELAESVMAYEGAQHGAKGLSGAEPQPRAHTEPQAVKVGPTINEGSLLPYIAFDEPLPFIGLTSPPDITANVVRIVATEGPVLGYRVHHAYRDAYGGKRVGKEIARLLNRAISVAERQGRIVADNPLNDSGVVPKTYRLPTQPKVVPRQLGPRTLELVPPAELAHHLAELFADDQSLSEELLFRRVLDRLGLKRLTDNAKAVLTSALKLVAQGNVEE